MTSGARPIASKFSPTMLLRLILAFAVVIVLVEPTVAAAIRLRVFSEDAYATQCRNGVCATVQVSRSTFSDGDVETILFVSAYDASGNPIIPGSFTRIDNALFVMNKQGTHASVNHPNAMVTWTANDLYSEDSDSTTRVIDKRASPFHLPSAVRLTERLRREGATAEGIAGEFLIIDTNVPPETEFGGDAFLTVRKTTRIERLLSD